MDWIGPLVYLPLSPEDGSIPVFDVGAGEMRYISTAERASRVLDWSPDGCYLAYLSADLVSGARVHVVNSATSEDTVLHTLPVVTSGPWLASLRWAPSGEWIAYNPHPAYPHNGIYLVRADGGEKGQLPKTSEQQRLLGWSMDGKEVLYSLYRPEFRAGGSGPTEEGFWELKQADVETLQERSLASFWQPLLAWEELIITDVNTLQQVPLPITGEPKDANYVELYWTSDLRRFAVFTIESAGADWYVGARLYWVDVETREARAVNATGFELSYVASPPPGGTLLAFEAKGFDGTTAEFFGIYVLDMTTGQVWGLDQELGLPVGAPSWSPDGTMLSFVDERGRALYDLHSQEITRLPEVFADWSRPLSWSPCLLYEHNACRGQ